MNQVNILATDKFKIVSKSLPQEFQFQTLTKLYQPFIGATGIALYESLVSELQNGDFSELPEWNHEQFLVRLGISMSQFLTAKDKLEAVQLLHTKLNIKKRIFLYELVPVKSGAAFFDDQVLSGLLMEYVGEQQFAQLLNFFEGNHWNDQNFQDISKSLVDTFHIKHPVSSQIKRSASHQVAKFDIQINVQLLKQLLSKTFVNENCVSRNLQTVNTVAVMYGLDEVQLVRLLEEAVDINHHDGVNWNHFRALASQQYQFARKQAIDTSVKSNGQKNAAPTSLINKGLIDACNHYAPMEFLASLKEELGQTVTQEERITIQHAVADHLLAPAVINVLVHYMLVNEEMSSLNQKYFERTANNWLKNKVDTPEKAIAYVHQWEKEHQKVQHESYRFSKNRYTEKLPNWAQGQSQPQQITPSVSDSQVNQDISRLMQRINSKTSKGGHH